MKNNTLAKDYVHRAGLRCKALETLFEHGAYADTVRESQEVVELALKGLLKHVNIEVPRIHDVGEILLQQKNLMPKGILGELEKLAEISRQLRRDRELAFYGSDDLTPSEFYKKKDAQEAKKHANWVVHVVAQSLE